MNTITSTTQATENYRAAVNEIQEVFNEMGFSTQIAFDAVDFEKRLIEIIRKNIEGNVTYAQATR